MKILQSISTSCILIGTKYTMGSGSEKSQILVNFFYGWPLIEIAYVCYFFKAKEKFWYQMSVLVKLQSVMLLNRAVSH